MKLRFAFIAAAFLLAAGSTVANAQSAMEQLQSTEESSAIGAQDGDPYAASYDFDGASGGSADGVEVGSDPAVGMTITPNE
jgi:hypothetical protein